MMGGDRGGYGGRGGAVKESEGHRRDVINRDIILRDKTGVYETMSRPGVEESWYIGNMKVWKGH